MSDPTNPIAPAAQEPTQGAPAAVTPFAPAPAAAAPQTAPEAPARPPYVNPWKGRAPSPVAAAAREITQTLADGAASGGVQINRVAAPAAPASDPRVDALMAVLGETVAQDLGALPANVAATVKAIAGDDPVAQRKAINAMRANGIAAPVSAPAAPAPIAPAATTINAPPVAAPEVRTQESGDADLLAHHQKLLASGQHYAASNFLIKHSEAITRAQARQSTN